MKIESITAYSDDYKNIMYVAGKFYCTVRIDFDFGMELPRMEERVYYKKADAANVRKRLNELGVFLVFEYDLVTHDILSISVRFDAGCQVPYADPKEMEQIIGRLHEYRAC